MTTKKGTSPLLIAAMLGAVGGFEGMGQGIESDGRYKIVKPKPITNWDEYLIPKEGKRRKKPKSKVNKDKRRKQIAKASRRRNRK